MNYMMGTLRKRISTWLLFVVLLIVFLFYIPTPYIAYEPGITVNAAQFVLSSEPIEATGGGFMLTTVKMTAPNYALVARSLFTRNIEILNRKDVFKGKPRSSISSRPRC